MANPNRTVAKWREKRGPDPRAVEAARERAKNSPTIAIMERFQRGEITMEEAVAQMKAITG